MSLRCAFNNTGSSGNVSILSLCAVSGLGGVGGLSGVGGLGGVGGGLVGWVRVPMLLCDPSLGASLPGGSTLPRFLTCMLI